MSRGATDPSTPRGERTRARIVEAARRELVSGDGAMEFATVAARAGVSAGLPYRYFASKSALLVSIVDAFFDDLEATVYRPTFEEVSDDWWVREQARIARTVDFFYDDPLGPLIVTGLAGDAEVISAQRRRLNDQVRGACKNLALGQELGRVDRAVDVELAGAFLMGGVYQAITFALSAAPRTGRAPLAADLQRFMARVLRIEEANDG